MSNALYSISTSVMLASFVRAVASALLASPAGSLSLSDLSETYDLLLRSGGNIRQINAVRRCISKLHGGGLARRCAARIITLLLSDVVDDDPRIIGSLAYLTPLTSTVVLILLGGHTITRVSIIAMVLIVGGALIGSLTIFQDRFEKIRVK